MAAVISSRDKDSLKPRDIQFTISYVKKNIQFLTPFPVKGWWDAGANRSYHWARGI